MTDSNCCIVGSITRDLVEFNVYSVGGDISQLRFLSISPPKVRIDSRLHLSFNDRWLSFSSQKSISVFGNPPFLQFLIRSRTCQWRASFLKYIGIVDGIVARLNWNRSNVWPEILNSWSISGIDVLSVILGIDEFFYISSYIFDRGRRVLHDGKIVILGR